MPGTKGNKNARRAGTDAPSTAMFMIRFTPKERAQLAEMAQALNVKESALVRDAIREYRMRAVAAGLKLKK
jgi:hypothetical protein